MTRVLVVPAAGRGSRLGSNLPKPLTPVNGAPMIDHVLRRHSPAVGTAVVIVDPTTRPLLEPTLDRYLLPVVLAEQAAPTGMLDAVLAAMPAVTSLSPDRVWITWCDQVAISGATVDRLASLTSAHPGCAANFPVAWQETPYIHFDRDSNGRVQAVRHRREGDPMPEHGLADAGLFDLSARAFLEALPDYASRAPLGARTGERNFLPFLPWLARDNEVLTFEIPVEESRGINTPEDLADVERWLASIAGKHA